MTFCKLHIVLKIEYILQYNRKGNRLLLLLNKTRSNWYLEWWIIDNFYIQWLCTNVGSMNEWTTIFVVYHEWNYTATEAGVVAAWQCSSIWALVSCHCCYSLLYNKWNYGKQQKSQYHNIQNHIIITSTNLTPTQNPSTKPGPKSVQST